MPPGISRRTFLKRSGIGVAGVLGGGALARLGAPAPALAADTHGAVGAFLERGVAVGPGGVGDSQLYSASRRFFAETRTGWVRMWADWPVLQPERDSSPDRGTGADALRRLDAEIARARADGLRVMLTAWRFPRWANGTAGLSRAEDERFELADRLPAGADPARRKDLTFRLPSDLSPGSDWGRWIAFLLRRYGHSIDALELLNEPNLQLWPQSGVVEATARMMRTAQRLAARVDRPPLLVAPATADPVGDSRLRTGYDTFTRALLDRLERDRFEPGAGFAWSQHGYTDVEGDLGGADNRVASVRSLLARRWAGWPDGDAARPGVLVTEAGARLDKIAKAYGLESDPVAMRLKQAELIERNWRRLELGPEGEGVALLFIYLFVTDAGYDSGLCELDGTPRPAYHAWAQLP